MPIFLRHNLRSRRAEPAKRIRRMSSRRDTVLTSIHQIASGSSKNGVAQVHFLPRFRNRSEPAPVLASDMNRDRRGADVLGTEV